MVRILCYVSLLLPSDVCMSNCITKDASYAFEESLSETAVES